MNDTGTLFVELWVNHVLPHLDLKDLCLCRLACKALARVVIPFMYKAHDHSRDQLVALHELVSGTRSVFLTGAAGVGKSRVLRHAIRLLSTHGKRSLAVTATTGVAALAVQGRTLHSFAGIGTNVLQAAKDAALKMDKEHKRQWMCLDVLVIDEASMISAEYFDLLDSTVRIVRNKHHAAFGGIRIVLCGDMLQLPPIVDAKTKQARPAPLINPSKDPMPGDDIRFVFESNAWQRLNPMHVRLHKIHRQANSTFVGLLARVRRGEPDAQDMALLRTRILPVPRNVSVTYLFPHRATVDSYNEKRLAELDTEPVQAYEAVDTVEDEDGDKLLDHLQAPYLLNLKRGAEVMNVVNSPETNLVNGDRGVVVAMHPESVDVKVYRLRCTVRIPVHTFDIKDEHDELLARRQQIPLRLAWALSVHKSQGATLTGPLRLRLDRSFFAEGQAYVALSRLQDLEQLYLEALDPCCFKVHKRALAFDRLHHPL